MKLSNALLALAAAPLIVAGCVVHEHEHHEREREVVVEERPAYREVYVEGRPAPALRVEVVPDRPRHDARWEPGHWQRDHGYWVWVPGHWR